MPLDISALCGRHAVELSDARWDHDDGLIDVVQDALRERGLDVSDVPQDASTSVRGGRLQCQTNVRMGSIASHSSRRGFIESFVSKLWDNGQPRQVRAPPSFFSISIHRDLTPEGLRHLSRILLICLRGARTVQALSDGTILFPIAALTRPSTGIMLSFATSSLEPAAPCSSSRSSSISATERSMCSRPGLSGALPDITAPTLPNQPWERGRLEEGLRQSAERAGTFGAHPA